MQLNQFLAVVLITAFIGTVATSDELPVVSGYAGSWSNPSGQNASFHLSGIEDPTAELHIYDINFRSVAAIVAPITTQEIANSKPWENGYGFEPQTIELPELQSGLYLLSGLELNSSRIPFIVSAPEEKTDIVVVYPTNTVNAYSRTENVSLYSKVDGQNPPAVSFHRPQDTRPDNKLFTTGGLDKLLPNMVTDARYKYIADSDLESYGAIEGAKLVIIPGHSEYWTVQARRNLDQFVDRGGSALVLSGNALFRSVGYDDTTNPTQLTFSPRVHFTSSSANYPTWESIGTDFNHGGNGSGWGDMREHIDHFYDGWKVLNASPSYLASEGVEVGDVIHSPSAEFDGVPYTECDPHTGPVVDMELLGFHELDLIAFENSSYGGVRPTCAAWIDFRQEEHSGRQITVGAMTAALFSVGSLKSRVTQNMIELLLIDQADFDGDESLTRADLEQLVEEFQIEEPRRRFDLTEDSIVDLDDVNRWLVDFFGSRPGDANLDWKVDFDDYLTLARNFASTDANWQSADFTGDRNVDFDDFLVLRRNFGFGSADDSEMQSVPEPTSEYLVLLAASCLLFACRRKVRH